MAVKKTAAKTAAKSAHQLLSHAAIVIGDGWAALGAVGFLAQQIRNEAIQAGQPVSRQVIWIAGQGSRMLSALPGMEQGPGVEYWQRLARGFGIEAGETIAGSFLREFRNKAFRAPVWMKAPTPEMRREVQIESLWAPERHLAPLWETRFPVSLNELDQKIRALLIEDESWKSAVRRIEGLSVASFKLESDQVRGVVLASGEEIGCETVIYADRWSHLPAVQGLPKNLAFIRRRDPVSVLQATFIHEKPMAMGVSEGFFGALNKDAGEDIERHVWGHFSSDGLFSFWTLCMGGEEGEDNHQIAKKLRRLKNALDKMFTGATWLPEGKTEFMSTVTAEQVRFQELALFSEGEVPKEPVTIPQAKGLLFVTDGYGPSSALEQVAHVLGLPTEALMPTARPDAEAESVHP